MVFLRLLLCYLRVFGAFPLCFKIKNIKSMRQISFSPSKLGVAYNIFFIIIIFVSNYFTIKLAFGGEAVKRSLFERLKDTVHNIYTVITAVFFLLYFCWKQEKVAYIANNLMSIRESSYILKRQIASMKLSVSWSFKKIVFAKVFAAILWYVTIPPSKELIIYFTGVSLCNAVISSVLMLYSLCLAIVQHCFETINRSLNHILKENESFNTNYTKNYVDQEKMTKIYEIRRIYEATVKVSQELSHFYALPVLISSVNTFMSLVICSYYVARPTVLKKGNMTFNEFHLLLHLSSMIIFWMVSIITLTRAAAGAAYEVS